MTADLDDLYQRMTSRLNQLRQERSELEEILAFYDKVLAAQQETVHVQHIHIPFEFRRFVEGVPVTSDP